MHTNYNPRTHGKNMKYFPVPQINSLKSAEKNLQSNFVYN